MCYLLLRPVKWIHQWFTRRRTKDRKNGPTLMAKTKAKARFKNTNDSLSPAPDPDLNALPIASFAREDLDSPYASGTGMSRSPQDSAIVKLDCPDQSALVSASVHEGQTSRLMSMSESISASGMTDCFLADLELGDRSTASDPAQETTPPLNRRKDAASKGRITEKEMAVIGPARIEEAAPFDTNIVDTHPSDYLKAPGDIENLVAQLPQAATASAYTHRKTKEQTTFSFKTFLPGIAPPKRSPMFAWNKAIEYSGNRENDEPQPRNQPSKLSKVNRFVAEPITNSVHEQEASLLDNGVSSVRRSLSQKIVPFYMQGTVFRTQWLNNGPSMYGTQPLRGPKSFLSQNKKKQPHIGTMSPSTLYTESCSVPLLPAAQSFNASVSGSFFTPSLVATPTPFDGKCIPVSQGYLNMATSLLQENNSTPMTVSVVS